MSSLVDRREVEKLLVLAAALRSGLVDAVDSEAGVTAEQAARAVGGDARASRVLLEALVDVGVVEREGPSFRLNALGRSHLVDPPPGTPPPPELERSSLLHQAHKFEGWLRLADIVKGSPPPADVSRRGGRRPPVKLEDGGSGEAATAGKAADRADRPARGPERLRAFVRTMGEGDPAVPEEVVDRCLAYAGPGPRDMIDVGGAVGHMARLFADRGLRATLFDRPDVLPEAREFLGPGAADIAMVGGDFTVALPEGPFDLAYLGNVYHIYGPSTLASLTRRVFGVLRPGGVICVRDFVWERSPRAAMFAVNMLQATEEGGVWREDEFREWLEDAGFVDVRFIDLERSSNQLVLGRKPGARASAQV